MTAPGTEPLAFPVLHLTIYTDSESSIVAIKGCSKYNASQWKAATNRRVLKSIQKVIAYRISNNTKTDIKYVKAHNNNSCNDAADLLAKSGCLQSNLVNDRTAQAKESVIISH